MARQLHLKFQNRLDSGFIWLLMVIKVGRIQELNFEPFYVDMERRGIELHDLPASEAAAALDRGDIDAAPISLLESIQREDRLQPVAGFCVAAVRSSESNLLFSKLPIQNLSGVPISGAGEDANAISLIKVLLELKYQIQPGEFVTADDPHEAILVTGDQALRRRRGLRGFPHRYDLGEEWQDWTGLPLVMTRWMARKDLDPDDATSIEATLYVGLEDGVDALYHVSEPRDRLLMLPKDIVRYVQGLRFFMGLAEHRSVDVYRRYLDQMGLI
jgi:chorismate dehydratase